MSDTPEPSPVSVPWLGYGLAVAGATLFAAKGIIIKLAHGEGVDALTLLALRMGFSAPVFLAVGLMTGAKGHGRRRSIPLRHSLEAMAVGAVGYWFSSYLMSAALARISAQAKFDHRHAEPVDHAPARRRDPLRAPPRPVDVAARRWCSAASRSSRSAKGGAETKRSGLRPGRPHRVSSARLQTWIARLATASAASLTASDMVGWA